MSDYEIKEVQSELSAIYPTPRNSRSKNNDSSRQTLKLINKQISTQNNTQNKSQNKSIKDIDVLAQELGDNYKVYF